MPRHRSPDPFTAWTRLAFRTGEMMLSAAEVIAHRTTRIAASGMLPHPQDRAEFARMGQEKVDAAIECAGALARHAVEDPWRAATHAWQDAWGLGLDLMALASSATPAQALHRHTLVMKRLGRASGAERATSSALMLSDRMLAPLHRRTAANVKRLRRARR